MISACGFSRNPGRNLSPCQILFGADLYQRTVLPGALALALTGGAEAQETDTDGDRSDTTKLDRLVVTANRTPTETSKVGSTVELVTKEEIEQKSLPALTDYLNLLPGVMVSSNGASARREVVRPRPAAEAATAGSRAPPARVASSPRSSLLRSTGSTWAVPIPIPTP